MLPVDDRAARAGRWQTAAVSFEPASAPGAPRSDIAAWRTEVGLFRSAQPRRTFPLGVHVGLPLGDRLTIEVPWPASAEYDVGLKFDLMAALVASWSCAGKDAFVWLTRPGVPDPHDADLQWLAGATRAFGAHGVGLLGFLAITRTGWLDVRSGERRVWKRLRL